MCSPNVESNHSDFNGAKHMLIRIRLLRAYHVVLLSGLLLALGQATSAQSVGKTPSQPPQSALPQTAKPQTPPQPVIKIADLVRAIEQTGRSTSIGNYIAEGVGIKTTQSDSSPIQAHAMTETDRELCVIDDTRDLLFMIKDGDDTVVYLANRAGVLQLAGYFHPGRFWSQDFTSVSKQKAAAAFAAEKDFWIKTIFSPNHGDAAKPVETVSKPDHAHSEDVALKSVATARTAPDASEQVKLGPMTPQERIKYLDQQIREAKQQAKLDKLEKKETAKEKKLATKPAANTPPEAKDNKSAANNPQAAPANSYQQSTADGDATPPKKKISWF
jgi:hypothetical protein